MKKKNYMLRYALLLVIVFCFSECKKKGVDPAKKIAKNWKAIKVVEGSTVVYDKNSTTNIVPGYANYSLNLSSGSSATLKEYNGTVFSATYTVSGSNLKLSSLNPQPTGLSTLDYTFSLNADETIMTLSAQFDYPKTGQTKNVYTLEAQ